MRGLKIVLASSILSLAGVVAMPAAANASVVKVCITVTPLNIPRTCPVDI
jgi:hypothetical protein